MSNIYQSKSHRKVYEFYCGKIPPHHEIHHRDGIHSNNCIENLQCVTTQEHYDIHYAQGDYGACKLIAMKLQNPPQTVSELLRLSNRQRIEAGTHNFLDKKASKERAQRRVKEGKCCLVGGAIQRRTAQKKLHDGTHNLLGGKQQREVALKLMKEGKQNTQKIHVCPYCDKTGIGPVMFRHHFEKCSKKKAKI
jgi:hypothetical protein